MKLLITGGKGQLGSDFTRIARAAGHEVIALGQADGNITDSAHISQAIKQAAPDIVINAAAYTAVDKAETEVDLAYAVNRDGAANVANACAQLNIPVIHISTDYVFDGEKPIPYTEDDQSNPLGIYGKSKWEGEEAVRAATDKHLIVRIAWVFGVFGHNFVKTMQRLAREREELSVVSDQTGGPTPTRALSKALLSMAEQALQQNGPWGTYHYCGQYATCWHGFAQAIVEETSLYESLKVKKVKPITTADYPTPAKRPKNSVLECDKILRDYKIEQPDWRFELNAVIKELASQ